jgi:hypothetical protein
MPDPVAEGSARAPRALDMAVLVGATLMMTGLARTGGGPHVLSTGHALLLTGFFALLTGGPALAYTLDRGQGRLAVALTAGALAGLVPVLLLLASAVLRLSLMHGPSETLGVLSQGAVIPLRGLVRWGRFAIWAGQSAFTGAAVAAVVWLIGIDRRLPTVVRVGLAAAVIAVGGVMLQVVGKP